MMPAWSIILLLALVTLTSGADLRESCNRCGYRTGNQIQSHSQCTSRNGYPKYFRDGHDCGKFYECNRGTAYEFLCSEGLAFNEDTKVCEHASKVRCSNVHSGEKDGDNYYEFPRASGAGQNRTCNICRQAKQAIPRHVNCPRANGYYPVMFRNVKDCTQFYQCDHGTAYLIQCPAGLHFNTRLSVCDYPRNVDCSGPVLSPESTTGASGGSHGGASPSSCRICQEAKNVIRNHPKCPTKNGYYPIMFRHQTECSKYYMCDNGVAFEIVCPAGLHFNTAINVCDYPGNVDCSGTGVSPTVSSETPAVAEPEQKIHPNCPIITGEQEASYWAHPRDCGKYFGCRWGCVEVLSCPEGHRWDDTKKGCAAEHLVECENDGY